MPENRTPVKNPGTIVRRFLAEGTWTASSAFHPGGGELADNGADSAVYRARTGDYVIPGSSLAGCCRSLAARLTSRSAQEFRSGPETAAVADLFGGKYSSLIRFSDGRVQLPPNSNGAALRDGVRIDLASGIAADDARYNFEVLPRGSDIPFRIVLEIPRRLSVTEGRGLLNAFALLLGEIGRGGLQIGAKSRKGLGYGKVASWHIRRFEMSSPVHASAWILGSDGGETVPLDSMLDPESPARDSWFTIELALRLKTSVLLRSAGHDPNLPDFVQLTEGGQPLVSGTSWAGVLRGRVETIVNTITGTRGPGSEGRQRSEKMFGPLKTGRGRQTKTLHAGRVWVEEMPLSATKLEVQSRVAIDRFTGGSLEAALFDEAPAWPDASATHGLLRIRCEMRGDDDSSHCALLMQAVKDIWTGDVAVGGESSVGRGVWQGVSCRFRYPGLEPLVVHSTGTAGGVRAEGWSAAWQKVSEVTL